MSSKETNAPPETSEPASEPATPSPPRSSEKKGIFGRLRRGQNSASAPSTPSSLEESSNDGPSGASELEQQDSSRSRGVPLDYKKFAEQSDRNFHMQDEMGSAAIGARTTTAEFANSTRDIKMVDPQRAAESKGENTVVSRKTKREIALIL